jgi:hypothetical protein
MGGSGLISAGAASCSNRRKKVMPIGLLFWIMMILWLLAYVGVGWWGWGGTRGAYMTNLFLWILLFLLGWHDFGFILQGGGIH